jgi:hypothetical protein
VSIYPFKENSNPRNFETTLFFADTQILFSQKKMSNLFVRMISVLFIAMYISLSMAAEKVEQSSLSRKSSLTKVPSTPETPAQLYHRCDGLAKSGRFKKMITALKGQIPYTYVKRYAVWDKHQQEDGVNYANLLSALLKQFMEDAKRHKKVHKESAKGTDTSIWDASEADLASVFRKNHKVSLKTVFFYIYNLWHGFCSQKTRFFLNMFFFVFFASDV